MKIVTEFVYPPIPDRRMDWQATFDGWDLGDPVGRGATEAEAIADLLEQSELYDDDKRELQDVDREDVFRERHWE